MELSCSPFTRFITAATVIKSNLFSCRSCSQVLQLVSSRLAAADGERGTALFNHTFDLVITLALISMSTALPQEVLRHLKTCSFSNLEDHFFTQNSKKFRHIDDSDVFVPFESVLGKTKCTAVRPAEL